MKITRGMVAAIDYTLADATGKVLDSSEGSPPMEYLHGFQNIIPGLERRLEGLSAGDETKAVVPAAEGYGERDESLVFSVPRDRFPPEDNVEPGMKFHGQTNIGVRVLRVVSVGDDAVVLDANDDLAGVELHFTVKIASVRPASEKELSHGHPHRTGGCCGGHGHGGHHHKHGGEGCCGGHGHPHEH